MTLGPGPGILADFGAVRSGTPLPDGAPGNAPVTGGAPGALFDDLVDAWLTPAADEDESGDPSETTDAVVTAFPVTLPLPLPPPPIATGAQPQPEIDVADATGDDGATDRVDAAPIELVRPGPVAPAIDPAFAIAPSSKATPETSKAAPQTSVTRREGGNEPHASVAVPVRTEVQQADVAVAANADVLGEQPRMRNVRELPGLTRETPQPQVIDAPAVASDAPTRVNDSFAPKAPSGTPARSVPPPGIVTSTKAEPPASPVVSIETEPTAEMVAVTLTSATNDAVAAPAVDAQPAVDVAPTTERSDLPAQNSIRRAPDVARLAVEGPDAPQPMRDVERASIRSPKTVDQPAPFEDAHAPAPATLTLTAATDVVTALATESANPQASPN